MAAPSRPKIWAMLGVLGLVVAALIYLSGGSDDQSQLVDSLRRKKAASFTPVTDRDATPDIVQLTRDVVAQKRVIPGAWVVQKNDIARPRLVLPFHSLDGHPSPAPTREAADTAVAVATEFLGADACVDCHQERHQGFVHTAHHLTSSMVRDGGIQGPLKSPGNQMTTVDPDLSFTMQEKDGVAVQTVALADWKVDVPMDIITGSGKVAQTFLYWDQDRLFESYVSYFSGPQQWLASPGFVDLDANFVRPILPECLECHVTYIQQTEPPNRYLTSSAVWGISCERCHGPGKSHVDFHTSNPQAKEPRHISNPSDLSRERQLDICGQCHSGAFDSKKPAFSYRPGEDLSEFHQTLKPDFDDSGIHTSNQSSRLRMSECFQKSEMTCTACHDPHVQQRGDTDFFRQACLQCHESEHCGMRSELASEVADRCVECHMPTAQIDDLAGMKLQGLTLSMADHFIRVDRQVAEEVNASVIDSTK
ncbi:Doubled CXXCH motif (Paired_CXXCH_1) [Rubripirellula lacrimiformis]|uniref:Doubled CXXCH motif (Paired_CXXCH_1) n=1 Tax=Rubripirellula lacrimiformis TaxID=1930273 RepID=A0A517NHL3_9BACT|nr:multiheme c-type cytochrome [Rubripirellula lacrimiformis]QDT06629.1 Doubled CXXCH motif (Paired_CXXCH_1) [Rubripirellula lacrimiformis]